jgi:hypothetical protein
MFLYGSNTFCFHKPNGCFIKSTMDPLTSLMKGNTTAAKNATKIRNKIRPVMELRTPSSVKKM